MIRRLGPGEGALWRAIRLQALAGEPQAYASRQADWEHRPLADFEARVQRDAVFMDAAGQGCAVLMADAGDPGRAWLQSMYVAPARRGSGLAADLIAAVAAAARDAGAAELLLEVRLDNARAQAAYARAGFVPVTGADRPRMSCGDDDVTMRMVLGG